MTLPPSRYRVVERGRRLVTIDTRTGQEYGADTGLNHSPISHPAIASPSSPDAPMKQPSNFSALVIKATDNVAARPDKPTQSGKNPGIAGKVIVLIVACLFLTAFLIMTNLWPLVVIPLAIPQVRTVVLTQGKATLKKLLGHAATG